MKRSGIISEIRSCDDNHIDYTQCKDSRKISTEETVTLYHGSKAGIHGAIAPVSRKRCDFGKGFYMGTERMQPLTLICNYPNARLYTLRVDLSGLKIADVERGLDWALLVAFNRGKMESVKGSAVYNRYADFGKGCDMLVGYIADDRMFVVLDRFFNGEITDRALINSLSALNLGKQYVAFTKRACEKIEIIDEQKLTERDRDTLKRRSEENRSRGVALANEICRKYRRDGRFFDELLEESQGE